jgi:hypothetical protein
MSVSASGHRRFAVLGEPIVAVDLIDTIAPPGSPVADDLLRVGENAAAWWRHQKDRMPPGDIPDIQAVRRLRAVLREIIEAVVDGLPAPPAAASELNFFTQSSPISTWLICTNKGLRAERRWHREYGGNPRLAFIAGQAAEFLSR